MPAHSDRPIQGEASLSRCGRHRTRLLRRWDSGPPLVFVGLNPSTADAHQDDPTLRRVMGFARRLGAPAVLLVNLFSLRATDPRELWSAEESERNGPSADRHLRQAVRCAAGVVACWGAVPEAGVRRARRVLRRLDRDQVPVGVLGLTKHGHPRHPLYLRRDALWRPWQGEGGSLYERVLQDGHWDSILEVQAGPPS